MCLDILGVRDFEDDQKISEKFKQKLLALYKGSIDEGLNEIDLLVREHIQSELSTAYEVIVSYRAKYYI